MKLRVPGFAIELRGPLAITFFLSLLLLPLDVLLLLALSFFYHQYWLVVLFGILVILTLFSVGVFFGLFAIASVQSGFTAMPGDVPPTGLIYKAETPIFFYVAIILSALFSALFLYSGFVTLWQALMRVI